MLQRTERHNLYAILDVPEIASEEQIKAAYRRLVRLHHPDANPQRREEAEVRIKQIIEAYGVLGDADKRARYDSNRRLGALEAVESSRYPSHQRAQGEPKSLLGRVRFSLGVSSHEFAAQLGLSDAVLLEMESRDIIPTKSVQKRTFVNLCRQAAQKLDEVGRHSDADDLRADLHSKGAQNQFYR